jgi:hypothetical protein
MALKAGFGFEIELPEGWYGEIYRLEEPGDSGWPVLHFANTPLILGERSAYAGEARQVMRANDVIVCVVNQPSLPNLLGGPGVINLSGRNRLTLDGASSSPFHGVGNGYSSLRQLARIGQRLFDVLAFFAQATPPATLLKAAEGILASARIAAAPPEPGQRIEQFFDSAQAVAINEQLRAEIRALETA